MAHGTSRRDPAKESFWRQRVAEQADSGLSVRNFCRQHDLKDVAFYWWRRELARRDTEHKPLARQNAEPPDVGAVGVTEKNLASFIPIHVMKDATGTKDHSATDRHDDDSSIEIILADGRRVRLTGLVNRQMLTDVLDVLERRAC